MVIYESQCLNSTEYDPATKSFVILNGFKIIEDYKGNNRFLVYIDEETEREKKYLLPGGVSSAEELVKMINMYKNNPDKAERDFYYIQNEKDSKMIEIKKLALAYLGYSIDFSKKFNIEVA